MAATLTGPANRLYAERQPGADEATFRVDNTSADYYNSPYYTLHKNQVQPIPPPRAAVPLHLDLADFVGSQMITAIERAGSISFHAVGDTGAAKVNRAQTVQRAVANEAEVADAMAAEVAAGGPTGPSFFFHLGDVVYNFGEGQYYYDQFYEPFRAYDRPIFAIPGNHDGMVFGQGSSAPQVPTLDAFLTNFCSATPGPSPDAGSLVRSCMTQPGVYFTLDAPFVSIIGLYSNILEGPGVISSQGGAYPLVNDQLDFLASEFKRLAPDRRAGNRAVILAVHHPPLSADATHAGTVGLQQDLDAQCKAAGLWPDLVLSGHAHLYQRFTRRAGPTNQETPYIVAGSGGFAATPPQTTLGKAPITVGDHTLEIDPIIKFGYLTVTCDAKTLTVSFRVPGLTGTPPTEADSVRVDLRAGKLLPSGPGGGPGGPAGPAGPAGPTRKSRSRATSSATASPAAPAAAKAKPQPKPKRTPTPRRPPRSHT